MKKLEKGLNFSSCRPRIVKGENLIRENPSGQLNSTASLTSKQGAIQNFNSHSFVQKNKNECFSFLLHLKTRFPI